MQNLKQNYEPPVAKIVPADSAEYKRIMALLAEQDKSVSESVQHTEQK